MDVSFDTDTATIKILKKYSAVPIPTKYLETHGIGKEERIAFWFG